MCVCTQRCHFLTSACIDASMVEGDDGEEVSGAVCQEEERKRRQREGQRKERKKREEEIVTTIPHLQHPILYM